MMSRDELSCKALQRDAEQGVMLANRRRDAEHRLPAVVDGIA